MSVMTKTKMIVGVIALVLGLATTALVGLGQEAGAAQGRGGGERGERRWNRDGKRGEHDGGPGRFARNLNLSDAQKQQMEQISARYRESTKSLREQLRAQGKGEFAGDGAFNEGAVRSAAQARASIEVELEVSRARMMSEMYGVLTPEQKTQLAQEREQWKQKLNERRTRRGANPDNRQ